MVAIPYDKRFSADHQWIEMEDEFVGRCGITEYLLEKLEDIVFVDPPEINMIVKVGERVGAVESHTAICPIISPVSGRILETNNALEYSPDLINSDPLGAGWIYKIDVKEPNEFSELMDSVSYEEFIDSGTAS
jgi:glycine cleavage system H protein